MNIKTDVIIIGAGISGLASAHFLKKRGLNPVIIEKSERPGGSIRTERIDGYLVEYGPNSTLDTSPILHELFADLDIESEMEYANDSSKNRYIMRDGKLNALPMGAGAFLGTSLFSWKAKLRLLREPFIKPADPNVEENLAQFVLRRLGKEFLDYAIDPFVAGVYAGLPEQLSVRSGFPKLYELEQKYGSLIKGTLKGAKERKQRAETSKQSAKLFSFRQGMETAISALQEEFSGNLHLSAEIKSFDRGEDGYRLAFSASGKIYSLEAENILLTIPVHAYQNLPGPFFVSLLPALENIYYPPVTMVFFGYKGNPADRPLDGFGYLIPRKENKQTLGTIWSSTIFSGRAPHGDTALTTFVGGSRQPENALLPEWQLIDLVKQDLKEIMGIREEPQVAVVQPWPKAIPQYKPGHQKIIDFIEEFENKNPGIFISGNFRGGISVGDCVKQASAMAEKIKISQQKKHESEVLERIN